MKNSSVVCCAMFATLIILFVRGCDSGSKRPKTFTEFELVSRNGFLADDLAFKNKGPKSMRAVDVEITIYREQNSITLERHWSAWHSGEEQIVGIPNSGGPLQRVVMTGKAQLGAEREEILIEGEFLFEKLRAPK